MASRKRREDLLSFDRGDDWIAPFELLRLEEEERRRQEEELNRQQPFRNVAGSSDTVPVETTLLDQLTPLYTEPREAAANIGQALRGGVSRSAGAQLFTAEDQNDPLRSEVIRSLIETLDFRGGGAVGDVLDRITGKRQTNDELARQMFEQGGQQIKAARDDSGNMLTRGLVDVGSSPSSFVSVFGGPAAGIGGADVFAQEYTQARLEGLDPANANKRAAGQAAVETALSVLPTGKLFGAFGGDAAKRFISDRARWASRTGATAIAEGLQEGATTLAQLGLDKLTADHAEDKALRDYANQQLPQDVTKLWEMTRDSIVAGALGGGTIGGSMGVIQVAAERGKLAGDILNTVTRQQELDAEVRNLRRFVEPTLPKVAPPAPDPTRQAQEDVAWEQRRVERSREDNQDALRQSIMRRVDTAQDRVFELEEAINEGDTSQATLRAASEARRRLEQAQSTLASFEQRHMPQQEAPVIGPVVPQETGPAPTSKRDTIALPVDQAKVATPIVTPPPKKARKTVTDKKAAIVDNQKFLNDALQELQPNDGLRSATNRPTTALTSTDVAKTIVNKLGGGDANVAGRLLAQGNVRLVNTSEDIPADAVPVGAAGYYDGRQIYVVANQVNPENVIGDFLTVAAHEIKHGGDLANDPTLRVRLGEVIGEKANARINQQILDLAEKGNPIAIEALQRAEAGSPNNEVLRLEIPAYFVQLARDNRGTGARRVLGDIVSSVRTSVKRVMPGDYEVNLNDVAYLSDQLLKETALQNPDLTSDIMNQDGLSMITGPKGATWAEAVKNGRNYVSRDGNEKRWLTDSRSVVTINDEFLESLTQMQEERLADPDANIYVEAPLDVLLKHDLLFQEYPQLRGMRVVFDKLPPDQMAYYDTALKEVVLDDSLIPDNMIMAGDLYDTPLHQVLLHEVQHAVQAIEGVESPGANPKEILEVNPKYKENLRRINDLSVPFGQIGMLARGGKLDNVANRLGVPVSMIQDSLSSIDQNTKGAVDIGEALVDALMARPNTDNPKLNKLINDGLIIDEVRSENEKLLDQANDDYFTQLQEQEARFTQYNIPVEELEGTKLVGMERNDDFFRESDGPNPEPVYGDSSWAGGASEAPSFRGLASMPFPRKQKIGDDAKAMNGVMRAVKRLLVPGGGFGSSLEEIMQHGKSLPASLSARSTTLGNDLLSAFKSNSKRLDKPEDVIREEIGLRLDAIDKIEDREVRHVALQALDREYPGIGKAVNNLRNFKLSLTQEIIRQRFRDPKPLSQKEIAIYTKMKNNAERYTTRAYLATYNSELGKRYGNHLMEQFKTDPNSEEGRTVQGAIDYLIDNDLVIPERTGLEAMKIGQLRRVYEMWLGSSARYKNSKKGREAMINKLVDLPPRTKQELDRKAVEVVRDLLGLSEQASRTRRLVTPSMRQNRTILEARTDLPQPLRKLMGEITDPFLRETISLQRMINLTTKTKVLTEIFEKGKDKGWWSDTRTPAHERELSSVAYGPLDGKWINQNVEDAITGTILSLDNIDNALADLATNPDALMKAMLGATIPLSHGIMSIQKTWQVVTSPFNMIANLAGAIALMAPMQGVINPKTYLAAMRNTADVLVQEITTKNTTPEMMKRVEELLFAGVTDSATMGEFRSESFQTIAKQIQKMIDKGEYTPARMFKAVMGGLVKEIGARGEIANALRQAYAFMDVWTKVATYYDRKEFLTEYNKLENKGWTEENIIRQAGFEASGTNVSYERAIPMAKILERNIPYFMFLTYFSETFRTVGMSYVQAYKDFQMGAQATDPKAKALAYAMGLKRFIGTTTAVAGVQAAVMHMLGSEDEEEQRKRKLDAPYMADKVIMPMGLNADGKEVMVELQRIDPIGPFNEFFTAIYRAEDKPQAAATAIKDMFVESKAWLSLWKLSVDLTSSALANATGDESFREWDKRRKSTTILEANYPEIYEAIRSGPFGLLEAGDSGENLVEVFESMFLPTAATPLLDAERTQVSEIREGDVTVGGEPIHEELRALGYKAYVRDPDKSLSFRKMDYDDVITTLRKERNELNARASTMDTGALLDEMLNIKEREYEAFTRLAESFDGYLAFDDTTIGGAIEIIDDKGLARNLRTGRFKSELMDGEALKRWYDSERKKPDVDKEELRQKYKVLRDVYKETN